MTSDAAPATAFVWAYLPGDTVPVVVGRVDRRADRLLFGYAASYLRRPDAISLYEPELPLAAGTIEPLPGLSAPGCILDAAPDAWGRRVILNRMYGPGAADELASADLDDLLFLLGADEISLAKKGVPMLYVDSGEDLITGGVAAGEAAGKNYTDNLYHKPADEYSDNWDLSGLEADVKVDYEVANRLANSDAWPNWYEGNEFKALRDAQRK